MRTKIIIILTMLALFLIVSSVVYGATYTLDKTIPATITINGTTVPVVQDVYQDTALTTPLTSLGFTYDQAGSATTTVYVPPTLNTIALYVSGLPVGTQLIPTVGSPTLNYIPITLQVSGGVVGNYTGVGVRFTGSSN